MIELKAIEYLIGEKPFYLGIIKAKDLVENFKVDSWSITNPQGYQRNLSQNRSKKFSDYLSKCKGIFHQTVLINIRDKKNIEYKNSNSTLKIDDPIYLVDGQHRISGLKILLESQPSYGDMPVPILVLKGFNREQEAREFLIVNKTQKGVRTDLADRLLSHVISEMDKELLEVIGIREPKKLTELIVDVCDKLNKTKGTAWYKRITLPNQKTKKNETIKQRSMTESLKYLAKDSYIQSNYKSAKKLTDLLILYWAAVKELCPKACGDTAKDYVLLKPAGPFILHRLLPFVAIQGGPNLTKTKIKNILAKIEEMNDDAWHKKGDLGEGSNQKFFNARFEDFKGQLG